MCQMGRQSVLFVTETILSLDATAGNFLPLQLHESAHLAEATRLLV